MTLSHVCTFLCLLAAASAVTVLYPSLNGSETLTCDCPDHQCQRVFWYRFRRDTETLQFLLYCTSANSVIYGENINSARFKASLTEGSAKITYALRISSLQKDDAGFYSCLLYGPRHDPKSLMLPGYYIKPGEHRPTSPPPTVKQRESKKECKKQNSAKAVGCQPRVLWSSAGGVLVLTVVLVSTLYYFSRLPKKCRHRFTKKMQLN
ncbi:uncharacterized protein cd8b [Salminus brasiliensis]|uniref:uncharacterized protein cd8b n=1 Tax=Salminus brasiliensis TaxID=930266 RepID=UPI003B830391